MNEHYQKKDSYEKVMEDKKKNVIMYKFTPPGSNGSMPDAIIMQMNLPEIFPNEIFSIF